MGIEIQRAKLKLTSGSGVRFAYEDDKFNFHVTRLDWDAEQRTWVQTKECIRFEAIILHQALKNLKKKSHKIYDIVREAGDLVIAKLGLLGAEHIYSKSFDEISSMVAKPRKEQLQRAKTEPTPKYTLSKMVSYNKKSKSLVIDQDALWKAISEKITGNDDLCNQILAHELKAIEDKTKGLVKEATKARSARKVTNDEKLDESQVITEKLKKLPWRPTCPLAGWVDHQDQLPTSNVANSRRGSTKITFNNVLQRYVQTSYGKPRPSRRARNMHTPVGKPRGKPTSRRPNQRVRKVRSRRPASRRGPTPVTTGGIIINPERSNVRSRCKRKPASRASRRGKPASRRGPTPVGNRQLRLPVQKTSVHNHNDNSSDDWSAEPASDDWSAWVESGEPVHVLLRRRLARERAETEETHRAMRRILSNRNRKRRSS